MIFFIAADMHKGGTVNLDNWIHPYVVIEFDGTNAKATPCTAVNGPHGNRKGIFKQALSNVRKSFKRGNYLTGCETTINIIVSY
jgi:hypothetical protein